jgi:hypothetical protein
MPFAGDEGFLKEDNVGCQLTSEVQRRRRAASEKDVPIEKDHASISSAVLFTVASWIFVRTTAPILIELSSRVEAGSGQRGALLPQSPNYLPEAVSQRREQDATLVGHVPIHRATRAKQIQSLFLDSIPGLVQQRSLVSITTPLSPCKPPGFEPRMLFLECRPKGIGSPSRLLSYEISIPIDQT